MKGFQEIGAAILSNIKPFWMILYNVFQNMVKTPESMPSAEELEGILPFSPLLDKITCHVMAAGFPQMHLE